MVNCNVVTKAGIVTVSLVSRLAGFETLNAAFRADVERLFTPDNSRR